MKWHEEGLEKNAIDAADRLAAAGRDFYLAGGTALALWIGHRRSADLDLFSGVHPLDFEERERILTALRRSGPMEVREARDGTVHLVLGKTPVSLFRYPYRLLDPLRPWRGLKIAGLRDIAAMKLAAVVGRGSRKDFVDLYWLCRKSGLEALLRSAAKKFPDHADFPLMAARGLVFFEDAEGEPMPKTAIPVPWPVLKQYFEGEVHRFLRRRTEPRGRA